MLSSGARTAGPSLRALNRDGCEVERRGTARGSRFELVRRALHALVATRRYLSSDRAVLRADHSTFSSIDQTRA